MRGPKRQLWPAGSGTPTRRRRWRHRFQATGIYVTLNPCQEALLGRANERLVAGVLPNPGQRNCAYHEPPGRPGPHPTRGISSSDLDHEAALEMAQVIRSDLENEGWPDPLVGDSGNGAHLIYPLDLPRDDESTALLKAMLAGLARRAHGPVGPPTPRTRPDRLQPGPAHQIIRHHGPEGRPYARQTAPARSGLISLPEARRPVPVELLESIAQEAGGEEAPKNKGKGQPSGGYFDLAAYVCPLRRERGEGEAPRRRYSVLSIRVHLRSYPHRQ